MEKIYSKYIRKFMILNILIFSILNVVYFFMNPNRIDGFFIALTGIIAVSFQVFEIPYFSLFYIISSFMYGLIAFDYGLIGEGIANIFISPIVNTIIAITEATKERNTDIHIRRENSSTSFIIVMVGASIAVMWIFERMLSMLNSIFSDWEAFAIIALIWGLVFSYRNKAIQWFFFLIRNGICLYLWHFINDRQHIELLWSFYVINNFLCILDYTLVKSE